MQPTDTRRFEVIVEEHREYRLAVHAPDRATALEIAAERWREGDLGHRENGYAELVCGPDIVLLDQW